MGEWVHDGIRMANINISGLWFYLKNLKVSWDYDSHLELSINGGTPKSSFFFVVCSMETIHLRGTPF